MRQISGYKLWLGHAGDLHDARTVMASEVAAVVELADNEQLAALPRELIRLRFPLSDGGDNQAWLLRFAVESIAALLRAEVSVLVSCSAGMSRSVCLVATSISLIEGRPLSEVLVRVVADGPADVSPGLLLQFQQAIGEVRIHPAEKIYHQNTTPE